ncbi:UDP-N-acetylglucosamine 2-epimerase [hydrothermal vent metagenome]|uniref:UDP-N-acetylglucosamine 2-epimerase n=1 Tax=hydrothermal vent metagenome TaxID=652676 RepID=A0A3B1DLP9_9ZZZZ
MTQDVLNCPMHNTPRRIAIVTGTRAEFGLLRPVMAAVEAHPSLELLVIAAGAHLIPPAETFRDVKKAFPVADSVPMQKPGPASRLDDAEALGRGVSRFARSFAGHWPDWVVVLGDRIEAFAAASAASIGGIALAHIHGGDRAEGIADEAMRHAITKLAHLHLAATEQSGERIRRMGELPERVFVVGSPAVDDLAGFGPMEDDRWAELGSPAAVMLLHPVGRHAEDEEAAATAVIEGAMSALGEHSRVLCLAPNTDPGREGISRAIDSATEQEGVMKAGHLPRERFIGLLRRLAASGGVLVGNSSAGLIEAAVLGVPVVNVGPRQAGRERAGNVVDVLRENPEAVSEAIRQARGLDLASPVHPYGDGEAGRQIAEVLAAVDPHGSGVLRKQCAY